MAVVRDFYIGNTHIKINDACCVKTQEEVDAILRRCGDIWYRSELKRIMREKQAAETTKDGENDVADECG